MKKTDTDSNEKLRQIIVWIAELDDKQLTTVKVMAEIEIEKRTHSSIG